jgi:quercetin dioxygenase-like cupin family protein
MTEKAKPGEPQFLFTDAASMSWRALAYAEGVEVKDLGTANGRSMQLVRCRPGTIFPTHHHRGPEFISILEGEAIQNGQRLSPRLKTPFGHPATSRAGRGS